jgi:hypothetical protein
VEAVRGFKGGRTWYEEWWNKGDLNGTEEPFVIPSAFLNPG